MVSYNRVNAQLSQLLNCSIVSRGVHSRLYSMHRLIQATVLGRLSDDHRLQMFQTALCTVDSYFPDYDDSDRLIDSWDGCGQALPHVFRLVDLMNPLPGQTVEVWAKLGWLFERASW